MTVLCFISFLLFFTFICAQLPPNYDDEKNPTFHSLTIGNESVYIKDDFPILGLGHPVESYEKNEEEVEYSDSIFSDPVTKMMKEGLEEFTQPFLDPYRVLPGGIVGTFYYDRIEGIFTIYRRKHATREPEPSAEDSCSTEKDKEDFIEVLNEEAEWKRLGGKEYFKIGRLIPSPSGRYVAYTVDMVGNERYTVYFLEVDTGRRLNEKIPDCRSGFAWSSDERFFLYEKLGHNTSSLQAISVLSHELHTPITEDHVVLSVNTTFELQIKLSSDRAFITITKKNYRDGCVVYYLPLSSFTKKEIVFHEFKIHEFVKNAEYYIDHSPHGFVVLYQRSGYLSNFGVYLAEPLSGESHVYSLTKALVEEDEGRYLMRIDCTKSYVYVTTYDTRAFIPYILQVFLNSSESFGENKTIEFTEFFTLPDEHGGVKQDHFALDTYFGEDYPILGTDLTKPIFDRYWFEDAFVVTVSSLIIPDRIISYDPVTFAMEVESSLESPPSYNVFSYNEAVIETMGGDNNSTITVIYAGSKKWDTPETIRPIWLTFDSIYGKIVQPRFNPWVIPLLEHGFFYGIIICHGGRNGGTKWHRDAQKTHQDIFKNLVAQDIDAAISALKDNSKVNDFVVLHAAGAASVPVAETMAMNLYADEGGEKGQIRLNAVVFENPLLALLLKLSDSYIGGLDRTEFGDVLSDLKIFKHWESRGPYANLQSVPHYWKKTDDPDEEEEFRFHNVYVRGGWENGRDFLGTPNAIKYFAELRTKDKSSVYTYLMRYMSHQGYLGKRPRIGGHLDEAARVLSFVMYNCNLQKRDWSVEKGWMIALICIVGLILCCFVCCCCWCQCFTNIRSAFLKDQKSRSGETQDHKEAVKMGKDTLESLLERVGECITCTKEEEEVKEAGGNDDEKRYLLSEDVEEEGETGVEEEGETGVEDVEGEKEKQLSTEEQVHISSDEEPPDENIEESSGEDSKDEGDVLTSEKEDNCEKKD